MIITTAHIAKLILLQGPVENPKDIELIRTFDSQAGPASKSYEALENFSKRWSITSLFGGKSQTLTIPDSFELVNGKISKSAPVAFKSDEDCSALGKKLIEYAKPPFERGQLELRNSSLKNRAPFTVVLYSKLAGYLCKPNYYSVSISKITGRIQQISMDNHHAAYDETQDYDLNLLKQKVMAICTNAEIVKDWIEWGYVQPQTIKELDRPAGPMVKLHFIEVSDNKKPRQFTFTMKGVLVGDSFSPIWKSNYPG